MKKLIKIFIFFFVLIISSAQVFAATYKLDLSHSRIGFKVSHLMIATVNGQFDKFSGAFDFDEKTSQLSNINVQIEASSINTNENDRDKHLRSADFLNVEKHSQLTFKSKNTEYSNGKPVKVEGDLTIAGITKPVTLEVVYKGSMIDPWGNERLVFEASTKIDRKNWGLTWNKTLDKGGVAVGDEITITIEGEAVLGS